MIEEFVKGGVTGLYPFEINADMDIVEVRKQFPTLQIQGGLDKLEVSKGKAETDVELEKKCRSCSNTAASSPTWTIWFRPKSHGRISFTIANV